MSARDWIPTWMHRAARWVLEPENARLRAELALANADARDTLALYDLVRVELAGFQRYAARRDAPRCVQVPLYSDRHLAEWTDRVRQLTGDSSPVEFYTCTMCAAHPLMGRPRHVRPTQPLPRPSTRPDPPVTRAREREIRGRLAALPQPTSNTGENT